MKKLLLGFLFLQTCHTSAVIEEFKSDIGMLSITLNAYAALIAALDCGTEKGPDISALERKGRILVAKMHFCSILPRFFKFETQADADRLQGLCYGRRAERIEYCYIDADHIERG